MESETTSEPEIDVIVDVELPDTDKLKCPECSEPYNPSDKRRVVEGLCGHAKCRICCINAERCITCFNFCPECGCSYNTSNLRRVKDTCEHFKCRACFMKSETCQRCLTVEKVKVEKEAALAAITQSPPVEPYPTKISLPRSSLSPAWSGPNPRIISKIKSSLQFARKTRSRSKAAEEGRNKPKVACSVCGFLFNLIPNDKRGKLCKHLKCRRCREIYNRKITCPLCKVESWNKYASSEKPLPKTLAAPISTKRKRTKSKGNVRFEGATAIKQIDEDAVVANCNVCLKQFINLDGGDVNCHCKPVETEEIDMNLTTGENPPATVTLVEDNYEDHPASVTLMGDNIEDHPVTVTEGEEDVWNYPATVTEEWEDVGVHPATVTEEEVNDEDPAVPCSSHSLMREIARKVVRKRGSSGRGRSTKRAKLSLSEIPD
ncbi:unnamed protein product [Orchesella dallaii]|uniref:RING-type domain-containing protein n=1 Tax=Orchesella dallaii TaxID=48710 RepID=A0ABP1S4D7_9HEXA